MEEYEVFFLISKKHTLEGISEETLQQLQKDFLKNFKREYFMEFLRNSLKKSKINLLKIFGGDPASKDYLIEFLEILENYLQEFLLKFQK